MKLHETKSIAQPRHRAVSYGAGGGIDNGRCKISVDKNVNLHGCGANYSRPHQTKDLADTRIVEADHRPVAEPSADQTRPLDGELQKTTDECSVGHAFDGTESKNRSDGEAQQQSPHDGANVKKSGRQRGDAKTAARVQDSHGLCR